MALFGKKSIRVAKNYTMGYSETQAKVRNATSSDPWPASAKELEEITQLSYKQEHFIEIMEILDKRLGDKGKAWRHVHKSLILSEHLLLHGPEAAVTYFRNNIDIMKALCEFQYVNEKGEDQGSHVRMKAQDIADLLSHLSTLRDKRHAHSVMHSGGFMTMLNRAYESEEMENENNARRDASMQQARQTEPSADSSFAPGAIRTSSPEPFEPREAQPQRLRNPGNGDTHADLLRAIEESRRTSEIDLMTSEERDIFRAMQLSLDEREQVRISPPSQGSTYVAASSYAHPAQPVAMTSSDSDLLIDVSIPEEHFSPQLQYTPYTPSMADVSSLQVSSPYLSQPASYNLAPSHVQLSPLQPQPYTPMSCPPPQTSAYGSNNPFAPPSSASPAAPTWMSSPSPLASSTLSASQQRTDMSILQTNSIAGQNQAYPSFVSPSAGTFIRLPQQSVDFLSAPGLSGNPANQQSRVPAQTVAALDSIFAAHTQGIDTFGNTGQMRYGASTMNATYKSNNPFANIL